MSYPRKRRTGQTGFSPDQFPLLPSANDVMLSFGHLIVKRSGSFGCSLPPRHWDDGRERRRIARNKTRRGVEANEHVVCPWKDIHFYTTGFQHIRVSRYTRPSAAVEPSTTTTLVLRLPWLAADYVCAPRIQTRATQHFSLRHFAMLDSITTPVHQTFSTCV